MEVWVWEIYLAWLSFVKIDHGLGGRGRPNAASSWRLCFFSSVLSVLSQCLRR